MDVAKISKVVVKEEDLTPSESFCLYLAGGCHSNKHNCPLVVLLIIWGLHIPHNRSRLYTKILIPLVSVLYARLSIPILDKDLEQVNV